jgi:hypothetical protein
MNRYLVAAVLGAANLLSGQDEFLKWDAKRAREIALSGRVNGQVGKSLDFRVTATDRSYNFKLRATWLTPEIIRALARIEQELKALSALETQQLVAAATASGSGIIPSDWVALLGPRQLNQSVPRAVRGTSRPDLRNLPALAVVPPRDYSYEVFWVVFPAIGPDGQRLFAPGDTEAELSVRIQGKVGKVRLPVPESIR